jgi:predicted nucleotidyltransferase
MYINYIKSESTIKPELVDTTSSKKYVYLRKDIIETQKVDEISNETITLYEYQEAKLTKAEYQEYLAELSIIDIQQQRADIDYIAIMTGVDLEV